MFWIAMGLTLASLVGFIILRMEHAPEEEGDREISMRANDDYSSDDDYDDYSDSDEYDDSDDDQEYDADETNLVPLKYITYILMGAALIVFVIYAFSTV